MRRKWGWGWALSIAAALSAAPAAATEPLDLDMQRFGAPAASIWSAIYASQNPGLTLDPTQAARLAYESVQRYRSTVLQLGLGVSSYLLEPPTTGGRLAFDVGLEGATTQVSHDDSGYALAPVGPPVSSWPVASSSGGPSSLRFAALHARKPLPYSIEVGARLAYVDRSSMLAATGEVRWAVNENWSALPDFALRFAYTRVFGVRDLELNVLDLDAVAGKRIGLGGVARITPYGALRISAVGAKTAPIDFGPTASCTTAPCFPDTRPPGAALATTAPFPDMKFMQNRVVRWTLGTNFETGALALGVEGTYAGAQSFGGHELLAPVHLPRSLTFAFHFGLSL